MMLPKPPQKTGMEDLPANPRLQKDDTDYTTNPYPAIPKKQLKKMRQSIAQTSTKAPALSTTQRRKNQADQPRKNDGKYAEKPLSKWKQIFSNKTVITPPTTLKKVAKKKTDLHGKVASKKIAKKPYDRNIFVKVHWLCTSGFRKWRRKKVREVQILFGIRKKIKTTTELQEASAQFKKEKLAGNRREKTKVGNNLYRSGYVWNGKDWVKSNI